MTLLIEPGNPLAPVDLTKWMKLQLDIGHFPNICGTCPNKNRYAQPNCPNDERAHVIAVQREAWGRG